MASLARTTTNRAMHLRIVPRPSNLGESREILRLLSQFGEIEYYKSLKYDTLSAPNAALVIYKDPESAAECKRRAPIRFRMGRVAPKPQSKQSTPGDTQEDAEALARLLRASTESAPEQQTRPPRGPLRSPFGLASSQTRSLSTASLPVPPPNPIRTPFDPPPPADPPSQETSRLFQITTSTSRRDYRAQINMGPYHGGFAVDTKVPGQQDLAKKVPSLGLSCINWRAEMRPWRAIEAEKRRWRSGEMSLGAMSRQARGLPALESVGDKSGGVGDKLDSVHDTPQDATDKLDALFGASSKVSPKEQQSVATTESDTSDAFSSSWDDFFSGISDRAANPVERYSRKRR